MGRRRRSRRTPTWRGCGASTGALRRGGLRWAHVDDDTIAFLREHPDQTVLVVARRAAGGAFTLPVGAGRHLFGSEPGGADLAPGAHGVEVAASTGPRLDVWEITA